MRKICKISILCLIVILTFTTSVFAKEYTNLSELVEKGKKLDGTTVTIQGEAIGEPLQRGEYTWVNIGDSNMALGVWMKKNDADKILVYGNSKYKGDIIKITGKFNRTCKEHGGDMDLHEERMNVVKMGHRSNEKVNKNKEIAAILLTPISLIFAFLYFKKVKFRR